MKRLLSLLPVITAFVLVSCQQELVETPDNGNQIQPGTTSFIAECATLTRSALSGADIVWSDNDAIKIFSGSAAEEYTISNGQGTPTGEFSGNEIDGAEYYAVYPYSAAASLSGGVISTTLPAAQGGVLNSFADNVNVAVAKSDSKTLSFKNVCGFLRLQVIDSDIKSIVIKTNDDKPLAGDIDIEFDGSGFPVVSNVSNPSSSITLTPASGSSFAPGVYIATVLPDTYAAGITITMTKQAEKDGALQAWPMTAKKVGTHSLTVDRAHVKSLGIVDSQIAWECLGKDDAGVPIGYHQASSSYGQYIDYQSGRSFSAIGAYNYSSVLDACFAYSSGYGVLSPSSQQASTLYNATNLGKISTSYSDNDVIANWSSLGYTKKTTFFALLTNDEISDESYSGITKYSELETLYQNACTRLGITNAPNVIWSVANSAKITGTGGYYAFKMSEGGFVYYGVFKVMQYNTNPVMLKFIYKIACEKAGTAEDIPGNV